MSIARKILMGSSGGKKSTYVDDVFNTQLFKTTTINADYKVTNNIDNSGEGGLVWYKDRIGTSWHMLFDTERGNDKYIYSNANSGQTTSTQLKSFDSDGYTFQTGTNMVNPNRNGAVWNFRKAPGFFDVVTYTGNGSNRTIAHSLGSAPGMIIIKRTDASADWRVYHRNTRPDTPQETSLRLNTNDAMQNGQVYFNDTFPTSSVFTVGTDSTVNANGGSYVAYIFAGGESTAATARSVFFNGAADHMRLSLASSTDLDMGTGDFTIEFWYNYKNTNTSNRQAIISSNTVWGSGFTQIQVNHPSHINHILLWDYDINSSNPVLKSTNTFPNNGTWRHVAISRSGSALKMFVNGTLENSVTQTGSLDFSDSYGTLIGYYPSNTGLVADISNLRVVKGTALYTSSFRPPYEPLTNITNTKLLCCNNSSVTGATVTPGTITAIANPTATTDSPFDDPEGFKFGEGGDQNIIKCGSYVGSGSSGLEVNVGFEPQWVLVKNASASQYWMLSDSMRGIVTGANDALLYPNAGDAEDSTDRFTLTPTGFKVTADTDVNGNGNIIVYIAIRRPDGYVGKPPELGTDVFTQAYGANSGDFRFASNFPVDFAWAKLYAGSGNWWTSARLIQGREVKTNSTDAEQAGTNKQFDSNVSWHAPNADNTYISHMWKRHAGFDAVTWSGDGVSGRQMPHSMGLTPEMIWVKRRNSNDDWMVYHKGLNGGTNPEQYRIQLNESHQNYSGTSYWNNTAPTSTHFTLGNDGTVNSGGTTTYIGMLFASVDGISKVGYYTGTGSATTITTGFQPRFLLIKSVTSAVGWYLIDTTRGWGSGNDKYLTLNDAIAQDDFDFGAPTSTGFTLASGDGGYNGNNIKYIYYAHA